MKTMKEMALEFSHAFGRPVNDSVVPLTVSERELLGKLIFEECLEYVTLGLGLKLVVENRDDTSLIEIDKDNMDWVALELNEGQAYDPIESADGLGDLNVLVNFNSLWHGFDIDAVTYEIFLSNMSKLDGFGKPIINEAVGSGRFDGNGNEIEVLMDPTRPLGKILKGPNYFPPDIARVIGV